MRSVLCVKQYSRKWGEMAKKKVKVLFTFEDNVTVSAANGKSSQGIPTIAPKIPHEPDARFTTWQLDKNISLPRLAADFYLLYQLSIEDADPKGVFKVHLEYLEAQFSRYTDMAVGGEVRHTTGSVSDSLVSPPLRMALQNGTLPRSRNSSWHGWRKFRLRFGTAALQWAEKAFGHIKSGGIGGKKWVTIANTLRLYEEEKLTPTMFVDICFGLQHNNGIYFNKAWNTVGLQILLNYRQEGRMNDLSKYASPLVKSMWVEHSKKRLLIVTLLSILARKGETVGS